MTKAKDKRVVFISDLHCGHRAGLTPPQWHMAKYEGSQTQHNKFAELQEETWAWYAMVLKELQPIHTLVVNGDAIDGKSERSGGSEAIVADRNEQVEMAALAISVAKAKNIVMLYGTPYHTGKGEDWEDVLARHKLVQAGKIGSHEWVNVNGLIFDVKHKVGGSSIPHGRFTAIARARLWNCLWASHDGQPKADVFVRSHVHYHVFLGEHDWLAVTTPGLQGYGSKYGARECEGEVHFGMLHFDVSPDGRYSWESHIADLDSQRARTFVV